MNAYTANTNTSTEPQTTEPKTVETGLPEAFKEKGVFVSLNEKDPSEGIHKAGEAFIQALRDAGFKLSGTHFNITVQPQTTEPKTVFVTRCPGGPHMTIAELDTGASYALDADVRSVTCLWFDQGELRMGKFIPQTLRLAR